MDLEDHFNSTRGIPYSQVDSIPFTALWNIRDDTWHLIA